MKLKDCREPWKRTLYFIKIRIKRKNSSYQYRGIKCLITAEELKVLWFRDKAYLMKNPSINRKDNSKNYTFKNCQYLEMLDNCRKQDNTLRRSKSSRKLGKALWKRPGFRKKMSPIISASLKKRWKNPEYRIKMSKIFRKNWKNIKLRKAMIKIISINSKEMWKKRRMHGYKNRKTH